jgi:transposase
MARWRQAVELGMTDEEIGTLAAIARSRSEAARRVERAQILLTYRENPSFFAVGQRLGVHHQTVQRCVERAMAYGPLAALDDRPRPGKEPTITPEAKAWLVSLACEKAKEHGYPHELWTTRLLARHARDNAPAAGHESLANLVQGTVCKILAQEEVKPHKVRYYLERRDAEFEQKMAEVLCIYREVQVLKKAAKAKKPGKPVAIVSYDEKPGSRPSQQPRPICRRYPASTRPSRVIMSTNAMARSACWPGSICSPGRFMPSSEIATAAGSSSNSSSFLMPPIQPARRSS